MTSMDKTLTNAPFTPLVPKVIPVKICLGVLFVKLHQDMKEKPVEAPQDLT